MNFKDHILKFINRSVGAHKIEYHGPDSSNNGLPCLLNNMIHTQSANRSHKHYERKLKSLAIKNNELELARTILNMGYRNLCLGEYNKSVGYHVRSLELFEKLDDDSGILISLIGISQSYNFLSDYRKVETINDRLFEIINKTDNVLAKTLVWLNVAEHEIMRGNHINAENYALKVHELSEKYSLWYSFSLSKIILGLLSVINGSIDKSLDYLLDALAIIEKYNYQVQFNLYIYYVIPEVSILDFLSKKQDLSIEQKKEYLHKIKKYCTTAIKNTRRWKTHYGGALRAKAKYTVLTGRNRSAEKLFQKSIEHCVKLGRRYELALSFYFYSVFLGDIGKETESVDKLKSARRVFREIDSIFFLRFLSLELGLEDKNEFTEKISEKQVVSFLVSEIHEINVSGDLENLFDIVIKKIIQITGISAGCFFIYDFNQNLEFKSSYNLTEEGVSNYNDSIREHELHRDIVIDKKDQPSKRTSMDSDKTRNYFIIQSALCIPVAIGDDLIGYCCLDNLTSKTILAEHTMKILNAFLSYTSMAIENSILKQRLMINSNRSYSKRPLTKNLEVKIIKAIEYIEENFKFDISKEGLAEFLDINSDNLGRFFKNYTNLKIGDYINKLRVKEAAKLLVKSDKNITDIAYAVGFDYLSTFNRAFLKIMNITPTKYRQKNRIKPRF